MMQLELIEQIIHFPIAERVEIIEQISRSLREDLRENKSESSSTNDERQAAYFSLRGIAAVEGKIPPTDEEVKEDFMNYLSEKHK